jgi:hypothetical protein
MFCREQAARLAGELDAIRAQGAELYAIGNGAPEVARVFSKLFRIPYPVYTDPSGRCHALAGMRRGSSLGPKLIGRTLRALRGGFIQGRPQGDQLQQGGVLIIAPSGELIWRHINDGAGDLVTGEMIVAALRGTRGPGLPG